MATIVQVPTADDTVVYFEVDEVAITGPERVSRGGHVLTELDVRLDQALAMVRPAARSIVDALAELDPEELTVEFGLKLDASLGAVIAKTGLSGHFTVTLKIGRPPSSSVASAGGA